MAGRFHLGKQRRLGSRSGEIRALSIFAIEASKIYKIFTG
jgi:hypothetical protein